MVVLDHIVMLHEVLNGLLRVPSPVLSYHSERYKVLSFASDSHVRAKQIHSIILWSWMSRPIYHGQEQHSTHRTERFCRTVIFVSGCLRCQEQPILQLVVRGFKVISLTVITSGAYET